MNDQNHTYHFMKNYQYEDTAAKIVAYCHAKADHLFGFI